MEKNQPRGKVVQPLSGLGILFGFLPRVAARRYAYSGATAGLNSVSPLGKAGGFEAGEWKIEYRK